MSGQGRYVGLLFVGLAFLLLGGIVGCNEVKFRKQPQTTIGESESAPETVPLQAAKDLHDDRNVYFPQISEILGGNLNGELLGFLWRESGEKEQKQFRALYLIDPARNNATKIVDPPAGFQVHRAALDNQWVAWVERNETTWKVFAKKRDSGERQTIDEGRYFKEAGMDYPSLALYNGWLVYNPSLKAEDVIKSQVLARNLNSGEKLLLHEVTGEHQYLGAPSIYEDQVVWHRGEWTRELYAEVYLYDLTRRNSRRLSNGNPAIGPSIWGRYVVWGTYAKETPETKNIMLYNLDTGTESLLTDAVPSNRREYWGPTISHGIVTWNANYTGYKPAFYVVRMQETRYLKSEGEQAGVYGSWFTWRQPSYGPGTFMLGLTSWGIFLDLTGLGRDRGITGPPLDLKDPALRNKLAGLTPPEVAAMYLQALKERRYDVLSMVLTGEPVLVSKEQYLQDIKRDPSILHSYAVARDYLAVGDKAYVCVLELLRGKDEKRAWVKDSPVNWHMTRENGVWKVDQLAAQ